MMARILPIEFINYKVRGWIQSKLPSSYSYNVLSAVVAGVTATSIIYPTDVLRQFMNNNTKSQISILKALKTMIS
jgi:hypothetical protein